MQQLSIVVKKLAKFFSGLLVVHVVLVFVGVVLS